MPNEHIAPDMPPQDTPDQFGKGCFPTPDVVKAGQYVLSATPIPVIDWSVPFRVPAVLNQKNQDGSSSCTAQATNYYVEALDQIEHHVDKRFSSRFIYSQSFISPDGGAYIWKAMSLALQPGVADLSSVPEGNATEAIMRDQSDNVHAKLEAKTDKYAQLSTYGRNIDYLASIVKDYHGFVTGFNGWNGMFSSDGTVINWSKSEWGHAVYVCGYEVRNGQKCLVFKNSWGSNWGDGGYGYLPEAFLSSGFVFDAYVFATILDLDPQTVILTSKHVRELQALEGYHDESGVVYWTGKLLTDYLATRLPDKVREINSALVSSAPEPIIPPTLPPVILPPPQIVKEGLPVSPIFTVGDVAVALLGAGVIKIQDNLNLGLLLIGIGVGLKILLAILNKNGVIVSVGR